ncbi:hypothetical protein GCM10010156_49730 [Planobispora rosea]|uniref:Uncharacterized protein n=1 Tax=Planobispora rosea TaxID=35762 RepID=A0A8J3S7P2_PLARO|nr:hypothetical protein [Planobispora rosea]GGS85168.1 hypothetical protein GCM10010156_49730 [Planobispora rosea]GIH86484.1 hypothetical protein Pro02_48920 [Planobispora rosea]
MIPSDVPALKVTPQEVTDHIDAINTRLGWPRRLLNPCPGSMVATYEPVDGIDVTVGQRVEVRIAGVLVGVGERWRALGNAAVRCLLPHDSALQDPYQIALNQGGAINAYQLHLLIRHGTHRHKCSALFPREHRCCICRAARTG